MTTVEQQLAAVNMQLVASEAQVTSLSTAIDAVRAEASSAVHDLRTGLQQEQALSQQLSQQLQTLLTKQQNGGRERELNLVNTKDFSGSSVAARPSP